MTEQKPTPVYDGIYGVKLGSKNTVVYDGSSEPEPIITCVRQVDIDPLTDDYIYEFGDIAEGWDNTMYPLKQGIPRNDKNMPIGTSIRLTKAFVADVLKDIPDDSGILFCLPMIKARDGLAALKQSITDTTKGRRGIKFFSEARAAVFGTHLSMREIVGTNIVVLNFGSSTVETVFHAGKKRIAENVYTFGGSRIDERLKNAIMQNYSGVACDIASARKIKEHYDWTKNNDIEVKLTLDGMKKKIVVEGDVIREIINVEALNRATKLFINEFIPACNASSEEAVHSLQVSGHGYLVLCGGMVNMPGFADELHGRFIDSGAISADVKLVVPDNGVTAPAYGAYNVAQALEQQRVNAGLDQWLESDNQIVGDNGE